VAWLWTDILAALLVEHDRVAPARLADWVDRPVAYRLADDGQPLDLARALLERQGAGSPGLAFRPSG
jgi:hypothetical protein